MGKRMIYRWDGPSYIADDNDPIPEGYSTDPRKVFDPKTKQEEKPKKKRRRRRSKAEIEADKLKKAQEKPIKEETNESVQSNSVGSELPKVR